MNEEPVFTLEIEDFDGWDEDLPDNEGWSDANVDQEMQNFLEDLESRQEFYKNECEVVEKMNSKEHVTYSAASLRDYIKSKRNPNTVKKTESVVGRFK